MDIVEIKLPNAVASGSLDRTILFYNIKERYLITVLRGHETGVRNLAYNSSFGGSFVSIGHESPIYVWSPETA